MHGLINKGLEGFLTNTYGEEVWEKIAQNARLPDEGFEALLTYDDHLTWDVLSEASALLGKPTDTLLEDLGTYLVSDKAMEPVRRLLRFGGVDFADFLDSLDELPERARLAVPSLVLPAIDVHEVGYDEYQIFCRSEFGRFGKILAGALRAMADDYGCLSLIEWDPGGERGEEVTLTLLDGAHSEGKSFVLGAEAGV